MERKILNDVALGAFILAGLGVLAYMSIAVGGLKLGHAIHVSATFDNAAGLVKDGAVMIAGVNVGSVDGLSVSHGKALVRLRLDTDAHVREDVKAAIRMKSLLGEKYVQLIPQSNTAPLLKNGDVITNTTVPVEIDQVMKSLGPVLKDVRPEDVSAVVHALALSLGSRGYELGETIDHASDALTTLDRVLGNNEHNIDQVISRLDKTMDHGPTLAAKLDKTMDRAPELVDRLDRLESDLEPTTAALGKKGPVIVDKSEKALDALTPTLDRLPRTIDRLNRLVDRLDSDLAEIKPILDQTKGRKLFEKDGSFRVKARLF